MTAAALYPVFDSGSGGGCGNSGMPRINGWIRNRDQRTSSGITTLNSLTHSLTRSHFNLTIILLEFHWDGTGERLFGGWIDGSQFTLR